MGVVSRVSECRYCKETNTFEIRSTNVNKDLTDDDIFKIIKKDNWLSPTVAFCYNCEAWTRQENVALLGIRF